MGLKEASQVGDAILVGAKNEITAKGKCEKWKQRMESGMEEKPQIIFAME